MYQTDKHFNKNWGIKIPRDVDKHKKLIIIIYSEVWTNI